MKIDDKFLEEVKVQIIAGNLKLALNRLVVHLKNTKYENEINKISGQLNSVNKDHLKGLITNEENNVQRNRITNSILLFISDTQKNITNKRNKIKNQNSKKPIYIFLFISITLIIFVLFIMNRGDIIDNRDNKSYDTIIIDDLEWIQENLRYDSQNQNSWCFDDNKRNCKKFGRLYTWAEAQKACNGLGVGWRLPTKNEWIKWVEYSQGIKNNEKEFQKLLGGERSLVGKYLYLNQNGIFWSSEESKDDFVWILYVYGESKQFDLLYHGDKRHGFSCKCVRQIKSTNKNK